MKISFNFNSFKFQFKPSMARDYRIGLHRSRLENKRPSHLTPLSTVTNLEVCREDPYLAAPKQEGPPLLTTFEPKKKKKKPLVIILYFCNKCSQTLKVKPTHICLTVSVGQKSAHGRSHLNSLLRVSQGSSQGVSQAAFLSVGSGDYLFPSSFRLLAEFSPLLLQD